MVNVAETHTFGYVWRHGLQNMIQLIYIYLSNLCVQFLTWLSQIAHYLCRHYLECVQKCD